MIQIEQIKKELESNPNVRPTREQVLLLVEYVEAAEQCRVAWKFEDWDLAKARLAASRRKLGLE